MSEPCKHGPYCPMCRRRQWQNSVGRFNRTVGAGRPEPRTAALGPRSNSTLPPYPYNLPGLSNASATPPTTSVDSPSMHNFASHPLMQMHRDPSAEYRLSTPPITNQPSYQDNTLVQYPNQPPMIFNVPDLNYGNVAGNYIPNLAIPSTSTHSTSVPLVHTHVHPRIRFVGHQPATRGNLTPPYFVNERNTYRNRRHLNETFEQRVTYERACRNELFHFTDFVRPPTPEGDSNTRIYRTTLTGSNDWDVVRVCNETHGTRIETRNILIRNIIRTANHIEILYLTQSVYNRNLYFSAPHQFLGDRSNAYGGNMRFTLFANPTDQYYPYKRKNIILKGNDVYLVHDRVSNYSEPTWRCSLILRETGFITMNGHPVSRELFERVLSQLQGIYIRSSYHTSTTRVRLLFFCIEYFNLEVRNADQQVPSFLGALPPPLDDNPVPVAGEIQDDDVIIMHEPAAEREVPTTRHGAIPKRPRH